MLDKVWLTIYSDEVTGVVEILLRSPESLSDAVDWATVIIRKTPANANIPGAMKSHWVKSLTATLEGNPIEMGNSSDIVWSPKRVVNRTCWTSGGIALHAIIDPLST
jgi:hypothetical protein